MPLPSLSYSLMLRQRGATMFLHSTITMRGEALSIVSIFETTCEAVAVLTDTAGVAVELARKAA